jgi:DNA polymerase-4
MVAKMATDEAKPNGYLQIPIGKEQEFLAPLKVNKIPGVGEQLYLALSELGIETIKELSACSPEFLEKRFGKWGSELWLRSRGVHNGVVQPYHEAKSISTENTFETNLTDENLMLGYLVDMTEKIAHELRMENRMAGCVTVKVRYADFETTTRQTTIPYTCYDDELLLQARELFHKLYRKGQPVRLLGVRLSELTDQAVQTNLFSDSERKSELYKAIDEVKERFGRDSISKAGGKKS